MTRTRSASEEVVCSAALASGSSSGCPVLYSTSAIFNQCSIQKERATAFRQWHAVKPGLPRSRQALYVDQQHRSWKNLFPVEGRVEIPLLEITSRLIAVSSADCDPGVVVDGVRDKPDSTVSHETLDSSGVHARSGLHGTSQPVRAIRVVTGILIRVHDMRVAGAFTGPSPGPGSSTNSLSPVVGVRRQTCLSQLCHRLT